MKKTQSVKMSDFLKALLEARSPSGYEYEAQKVLDKYMQPLTDAYQKDVMGNRIGILNNDGDPTVMLAGHMDELGFMVRYIDDKGFIYFDTIGGQDLSLIPGRRVQILAKNGTIRGVTGKIAIHQLTPEERKKILQLHELSIDIGSKDKKETEKYVSIGDSIVYEHTFEPLLNNFVTGRAFDDKAGCYVAAEVLRRLSKKKKQLKAKLVSVASVQEEVGVRGATTSSYAICPDFSIAIDVGHATDYPNVSPKKFGEFKLGKGPIISRGPNVNPILFDKLISCAQSKKIPYQIEAEARPTGTDARVMQMARGGSAAALISIPLRYMHTPNEVVNLQDIEHTISLLEAFLLSLKKGERGIW